MTEPPANHQDTIKNSQFWVFLGVKMKTLMAAVLSVRLSPGVKLISPLLMLHQLEQSAARQSVKKAAHS